jgi:hypothetical protein
MVWIDAIKSSGGSVPTLNPKEKSQANMLLKKISAFQEAEQAIKHGVAEWYYFVKDAGGGPTYPHVGFALAHAGELVNFFTESQKIASAPWKGATMKDLLNKLDGPKAGKTGEKDAA